MPDRASGRELINTDGLALIGPGSEWFWTALQFTALAITFISDAAARV